MLQNLKQKTAAAAQRVALSVDEKMAKVDEQIDRVASMRRSNSQATEAAAPSQPSKPVQPLPSPVKAESSTPNAVDASAAAKAFESVPKAELVTLLVKTNGRCKQVEMRYAELKRLHEATLEEKRKLVATRGRAGASIEAEREEIETSLRQSYEDRMAELEETIGASGQIKKQLQQELAHATAQLRDESAARAKFEKAVADGAAEAERLRSALGAAERASEVAGREAASARGGAAAEQAKLLERVLQLEGELAAAGGGGGGGGGGIGSSGGGGGSEVAALQASEAARRAEREAALSNQHRMSEQLAAGEKALALAHEAASSAERAQRQAAEEASVAMGALREELATKEKALSRALSNYKDEVGRWGEARAALERARQDAVDEGEAKVARTVTEWQAKVAAAQEAAEKAAADVRLEMEAELLITRSTAATESGDAKTQIENERRRATASVGAAVAARDAAIGEAEEAKEAVRVESAAKVRAAESALGRAQESEARLLRERDDLAKKFASLQREMLEQSNHASAQAERW